MKLLNRYIVQTLMSMTFIVAVAIMGLDFFIQLLGEFSEFGKGNYHLINGIGYVLLNMPSDFYQLFPMMGLIGSMLGLGLLAGHSELIIMRTSGMSMLQLIKAVMYAILIMVAISTVLGEWIGPLASHQAIVNKSIDKSGGQGIATQQGVWLRDQNNFIHIEEVTTPTQILGITQYAFNQQRQLSTVSFAASGQYQQNQWNMQDVTQSVIGSDIKAIHMAHAIWTMQLNPLILKLATVDPTDMTLPKLYRYNSYRKANALEYAHSALIFWQRIAQPLATMVMMLLAIPFIFGPLRTVTMGLRLVAGIVVGFSFFLFNQFFGPLSLVYNLPPLLAALIPTTLFGGFGLWLLLKIR